MSFIVSRRGLLGGACALAAAMTVPLGRVMAAAAEELSPVKLPPPISSAERAKRLSHARDLMRRAGIGAVLVESGPSLDYYTGIQWWRSERLTGVVIPAEGDPLIVTPFFERPTIEEMLGVPAEIRTWEEDEEPLKLVADFLRERKVAGQPVGFEETNRFFLEDRLKQQLPGVPIVSANSVVRAQRMIKSPAELALMQSAADIMVAALRYAGERTREGMTGPDIDALIAAAHKTMGAAYDGGLILIGEASAYPHGSKQPHIVKRGRSSCSTAPARFTAIKRTSRGPMCSAMPRPRCARSGTRCIEASRSRWPRRRSARPQAASMMRFAVPTKAGATARATSSREHRTAPATASAWRCMSR